MSLRFIDVSNWQAGLKVPTVARNGGLSAVVVKATEGIGFVDKSCDGFVQQCINNGIRFGFYHFARNNDAAAEAEYFRNHTKGYEKKGIPILDWEDGQSIAWVNKFVERYHELTGIWPWVYGNAWRFNQGTVNTNCGRWIAGYPSNGITNIDYGLHNDMPYKVNNGLVCAWQFSSSVRIAGYNGNLDGDVFYGDTAAWDKYAGGSPSGSTSTPAPTPDPAPAPSADWKVGDSVQFTSPYDENGTRLAVSGTYTIMEIKGSRIVVGRGGVVTAAVPKGNLKLVGDSSGTSFSDWKVGDSVQFTSPYDENGTRLAVRGTYTIMEIKGSRIVVGRGGVVTAAVPAKNLKKC